MPTLSELGWGPFFQAQLNGSMNGMLPGRIAEEHRGSYSIYLETGLYSAVLPGRFLHQAADRSDIPAVGDWALARALPGEDRVIIERLLERRTRISRKAAGETTEEQILAANVDIVLLITSLNRDLNPRRIERYLAVIWDSGAIPVIVLNKADLCEDAAPAVAAVEGIAPGVDILPASALNGEGLQVLARLIAGRTAALVGSSGVGKSTLVNRLLESDRQAVSEVRSDGKGRHTTTTRQLFLAPTGVVLIDTPGLRELQLWSGDSGLDRTFADIEEAAQACAFRDCRHSAEPGCAIQAAIVEGALELDRLESYRKLQREQEFIEARQDRVLRSQKQRRWKQITKENRRRMKQFGR